ncbi:Hypothetical predicted protein [Octopus vulgaris]|uniref:Uncharacterized protein n=1 Tax=Octopus vulgaris TaxID=6645 RepID=A0AA36F6Z6_OCTVU|nr:Hypothetical predicted protein [Octopus vulgaris]
MGGCRQKKLFACREKSYALRIGADQRSVLLFRGIQWLIGQHHRGERQLLHISVLSPLQKLGLLEFYFCKHFKPYNHLLVTNRDELYPCRIASFRRPCEG